MWTFADWKWFSFVAEASSVLVFVHSCGVFSSFKFVSMVLNFFMWLKVLVICWSFYFPSVWFDDG